MDKIRIKLMVCTTTNRASAPKERAWKQMAHKLADLWDNGNYA